MTEIAPPIETGEIRNGVLCLPDTVPDLPEVSKYFRKMFVGIGQSRAKLRELDEDLRTAIVAAKGRAPTLGELMVIQTILIHELDFLLSQKMIRGNQKDQRLCLEMVERQRKACVERDRHFEKLGLGDQATTSLAAILYGK